MKSKIEPNKNTIQNNNLKFHFILFKESIHRNLVLHECGNTTQYKTKIHHSTKRGEEKHELEQQKT